MKQIKCYRLQLLSKDFFFFPTNTIDPKQRAAIQNISKHLQQKGLFLLHLAAMTVVGPVDNMNTHIHCPLLYIDACYKYVKLISIKP